MVEDIPRHGEKEGIPSIEISDLLDALKIDMWKARVNEDPSKRISKVSLLIKQKESDPKSVLTLDLPVDEPGTLLVYLQDNIHERDKIGIVYHGDSGRSGSISDLVDDPFANVVGIQTAISVGVGRPGIIVLRSSGASADITRPETVAIFLNNE